MASRTSPIIACVCAALLLGLLPSSCLAFSFVLGASIGGGPEFEGSIGFLVADIDGDGIDLSALEDADGTVSQATLDAVAVDSVLDSDGDDLVIWIPPLTDLGTGLWTFDGTAFIDTDTFSAGKASDWSTGDTLYLVWSDGTSVRAYTNPSITSTGATIAFSTPSSGAVDTLIDVTPALGGSTSSSTFAANVVTTVTGGGDSGGGTTDSIGNTLDTSSPLTNSTTLNSAIDSSGDLDFFRIEVPELSELTISFDPDSTNLRAYVVDAYGNLIVRANQQTAGSTVLTRTIDLGAGTYFLRIEGTSGSTGAYSVQYTLPQTKSFTDTGWHYTNQWGWLWRANVERWAFCWDGLRWLWIDDTDGNDQWAYSYSLEEWIYSYPTSFDDLFIQGEDWGNVTWDHSTKQITRESTGITYEIIPGGASQQ